MTSLLTGTASSWYREMGGDSLVDGSINLHLNTSQWHSLEAFRHHESNEKHMNSVPGGDSRPFTVIRPHIPLVRRKACQNVLGLSWQIHTTRMCTCKVWCGVCTGTEVKGWSINKTHEFYCIKFVCFAMWVKSLRKVVHCKWSCLGHTFIEQNIITQGFTGEWANKNILLPPKYHNFLIPNQSTLYYPSDFVILRYCMPLLTKFPWLYIMYTWLCLTIEHYCCSVLWS